MPSFDVVWTRGVEVLPFDDPAKGNEKPGRLNPRQNISPLHSVTQPGTFVQFKAVVAGVVGPPDSDDPTAPFLCSIIEYGGTVLPRLHSPFGKSSIQSFWARAPGHYTVRMLRLRSPGDTGGGGGVILHLSCEAP